jgi:hypothetical protein
MPEVNIYQYAEINIPLSPTIRIGSKSVPTTISLTGTGEQTYDIYNDVPGQSVKVLYNSELTGIKWWAIKATKVVHLSWLGTSDSGTNPDTSDIKIPANVWQFFNSGSTTEHSGSNVESRPTNSEQAITKVVAFVPLASDPVDIQFIAVY